MKLIVFGNFNVAVFDRDGNQLPECQKKSLLSLFAEHLEKCGHNPDGLIIETNHGNWKMRKTPEGWNRDAGD